MYYINLKVFPEFFLGISSYNHIAIFALFQQKKGLITSSWFNFVSAQICVILLIVNSRSYYTRKRLWWNFSIFFCQKKTTFPQPIHDSSWRAIDFLVAYKFCLCLSSETSDFRYFKQHEVYTFLLSQNKRTTSHGCNKKVYEMSKPINTCSCTMFCDSIRGHSACNRNFILVFNGLNAVIYYSKFRTRLK